MQRLYENISNLRGLFEAFEYKEDSKEGKILGCMIDALEELTDAVNYLSEEHPAFEKLEQLSYSCPNCSKSIEINQETMETEKEMICPKCGEAMIILTGIEF